MADQRSAAVVDLPMTGTTEQRQVVEVRATLCRRVPRDDVVSLTSLERCATKHTSPIAYRQGKKLGRRPMPLGPSQPQRPTIEANDHRRQIPACRQLGDELIADRTAAHLGGRPPVRPGTDQILHPDRDHDRRSSAASAGRTVAPGNTTQSAKRGIEAAMIERDMLIGSAIPPATGLVEAIGVAVEQRPDLIDDRVWSLDSQTGQARVGPTRRNRVPSHPPGRRLRLIPGVGIVGRRLLLQVPFHDPGRLIGIEPTGQIQQIGRNLAGRLVGRLRQRVDAVTTEGTLPRLFFESRVGCQRHGPAGISIDRTTGSTTPPCRQMGPSPAPLGAGITAGARQPGNRQ